MIVGNKYRCVKASTICCGEVGKDYTLKEITDGGTNTWWDIDGQRKCCNCMDRWESVYSVAAGSSQMGGAGASGAETPGAGGSGSLELLGVAGKEIKKGDVVWVKSRPLQIGTLEKLWNDSEEGLLAKVQVPDGLTGDRVITVPACEVIAYEYEQNPSTLRAESSAADADRLLAMQYAMATWPKGRYYVGDIAGTLSTKKPNTMQSLNDLSIALRKVLSPSKRKQYKTGYLNSDLSLSPKGRELIWTLLAEQYDKDLTAAAQEELDAEKK